ncbi:hypothetical protein AAFF_G00248280 [Aldrovandia affinis]|uniref:G-protein coupled receptors family 1 profile domain-containing protein n=1 Tax=Aldrovandia affinis TaxID=143900 RepID=A0AAD7RD81_9TELE|nr:hypothetical protein AAFF_G00248280 [Aldrovandia affinis]
MPGVPGEVDDTRGEFSSFMDLSETPDWNDVEACIKHLGGKGVPIDDAKCFNQAINCTELVTLLQWYYLPTMYGLEFCLGLLGNLVIILGYVFCLKEWKSTNVYLFNLAVSDLVFLCTLPRLVRSYANGWAETSPFLCVANRYILHVNLYSSILFMAWVSVDRFLLVRSHGRPHFLLRRDSAVAVSALTWVVVNAQVAPLLLFILRDMEQGNGTRCSDFAGLSADGALLPYSLVLTATGYILPMLVLCLSYAGIVCTLRAQEGAFKNRTSSSSSFRHPLHVVEATAAMFLVMYTPYHVMRNVYVGLQRLPGASFACVKSAYILTRPLAFAHSVVQPVLYFLMGEQFRELLLARLRSLFQEYGPRGASRSDV